MKTVHFDQVFDYFEKFWWQLFFDNDAISTQNLTLNIFSLHTDVDKTNGFRAITKFLKVSQPPKKGGFQHLEYPTEKSYDINFQKFDQNTIAQVYIETTNTD